MTPQPQTTAPGGDPLVQEEAVEGCEAPSSECGGGGSHERDLLTEKSSINECVMYHVTHDMPNACVLSVDMCNGRILKQHFKYLSCGAKYIDTLPMDIPAEIFRLILARGRHPHRIFSSYASC